MQRNPANVLVVMQGQSDSSYFPQIQVKREKSFTGVIVETI